MKRIVHYLNQFYGQIGGEEFADQEPILREGIVGPGTGLQAVLGEKAEIVATIICGDNYFADHQEDALETILTMTEGLMRKSSILQITIYTRQPLPAKTRETGPK